MPSLPHLSLKSSVVSFRLSHRGYCDSLSPALRCRDTSKLAAGHERETFLRDLREQLHAHPEAVLQQAARHPEWNALVKIHPLEHREFYYRWARGHANIFIGRNRPIDQFLFHCDVLLQRGCTTSTEAWMIGKPVLELEMGHLVQ